MPQATICAIDDNRDNLDLLEQELGDAGYRVVTATSGHEGLKIIAAEKPDLVLLDIMMPGLSGHDVCHRLRSGPATATLPIILVTAKTGTRDEVIGLDAGANDYVTKPINIDTLLARVRTQLRIKTLQDELRRNYDSFVRLDQARQDMISMITHDLKTPLMTIGASTKLLLGEEGRGDTARTQQIAHLLLKSTQKMQELVEDFLSLAKWERSGLVLEIEVCDVAGIAREVTELFASLIRERGLGLRFEFPAETVLVFADGILLGRVWQNLLSNAIKYNRPGGEIVLGAETGPEGRVICRVSDTGIGIPAEVLPKVFDAYFRRAATKEIEGTGLGLAVVRAILEAHRSAYRILSTEGEGTEFVFNLPPAPSAQATPPAAEELELHPFDSRA
jgi:two-component system sensor histidine kinase/response regulator